jgi:hypothetical protein
MNKFCVKWDPSYHNMARSQVADGGDGLQIWRVAANILNKQSRTADKGWSSPKKGHIVTKCFTRPWTWTDSLNKRAKVRKMDIRFGTWNVRNLYRAGSLITVATEIARFSGSTRGPMGQGWQQTSWRIYMFLWKGEWESWIRCRLFCT